jgi:hypothetical protein
MRPIKIVTYKDVAAINGKVTSIFKGNGGDIYFQLTTIERPFYINRAEFMGLNLDTLNKQVLNKTVTLHHINRWTPLTTNKIHPHISKLQVGELLVFNEIIE